MNKERTILWVTATGAEASVLGTSSVLDLGYYPGFQRLNDGLLITGPGLLASSAELTALLATDHFDAIIHFGIAGSFQQDYPPGTVVQVVTEELGDFGADNRGVFIPAFDLKLANPDQHPFRSGILQPEIPSGLDTNLPHVHGTTVHTVHGSAAAIDQFRNRSSAAVESMEGAAVFYAAIRKGVPCLQLRAISNWVEPRNRDAWEIGKALEALKSEIIVLQQKITAGSS